MFIILCLETLAQYHYVCRTPYEAMDKLLYCLNLQEFDRNAAIQVTNSGRYLWMEHGGKTYAVKNRKENVDE